jgi:DNA polymerase-3 subunit chi
MTRVGFYHLQKSPLEKALPKLLEKSLQAGHRVVILAGSKARVEALDASLWTADPDSWLPHGAARDGNPEEQPIWLTDSDENPNGADLVVLTDGMESARLAEYVRCLDLFDGRDEEAVAAARKRWKACLAAGHEIAYYQQTEAGGWQEKHKAGGEKNEPTQG